MCGSAATTARHWTREMARLIRYRIVGLVAAFDLHSLRNGPYDHADHELHQLQSEGRDETAAAQCRVLPELFH